MNAREPETIQAMSVIFNRHPSVTMDDFVELYRTSGYLIIYGTGIEKKVSILEKLDDIRKICLNDLIEVITWMDVYKNTVKSD